MKIISKYINTIIINNRFIILGFLLFLSSCDKEFVEVDLPNSLVSGELVFQNDETAIAAATGMYTKLLSNNSFIGQFNSIAYLGGFSSDELIDYSNTAPNSEFYQNQLNANNSSVLGIWSSAYNIIYEANAVIEGVTASTTLSPDVKTQLEGEGKFVRAFCYFYLVNLFGDVPLITSTNYQTNSTLGRSDEEEVYNQIINDLTNARILLTEDYSGSSRVRPNKWAATALLSRIYLYNENYSMAELESTSLINSSQYTLQSDINNVFLRDSNEAILQLVKVYPNGFPTPDGVIFYISSEGATKDINSDLLNSFEVGDLRKDNWITTRDINSIIYYRPNKYKVRFYFTDSNYPEDLVLLRLAEQYLIRAEARINQNDIVGAQEDINVIRNRAGLLNTTAASQPELLLAVEQERRHELFSEMGHRWLDLKRTNRAATVLGPIKSDWNSEDVLYPIPESEILKNINLTQNPGY